MISLQSLLKREVLNGVQQPNRSQFQKGGGGSLDIFEAPSESSPHYERRSDMFRYGTIMGHDKGCFMEFEVGIDDDA